MRIGIYNPEIDDLERSYLVNDIAEATALLELKSVDGFAANDRVLIGAMGGEQSEVASVLSITDESITLTAPLKLPHTADDPVTVLQYDQVTIYRSDSLAGTYDLLDTVDIDVTNPDQVTPYNDTTAAGSVFYKTKFYHSITFEESEMSDPISSGGYDRKSIGSVIQTHVSRVRDKGFTVLSVDDYLELGNEVNDDLISQAHRPYTFTRQTVKLNRVANQDYVELPDNLVKFNWVKFTDTLGGVVDTYSVTPISYERWLDRNYATVGSGTRVYSAALDEEVRRLYFRPSSATNLPLSVILNFWGEMTDFNDVADKVQTPNTLIYKYKFMAEYYSAKAETDSSFLNLAQKYEGKYGQEIVKMQRMNRLDAGTPRSFTDGIRRSDPYYRKRFNIRG